MELESVAAAELRSALDAEREAKLALENLDLEDPPAPAAPAPVATPATPSGQLERTLPDLLLQAFSSLA